MKTIRSITLAIAFLLLSALPIALLSTPAPTSASPKTPDGACGLAWRVTPTNNATTGHNFFLGVDAISPTDVWAVGSYYETISGNTLTHGMLQHWDGTSWSLVSLPLPGESNYLNSISAISPTDIWAAGFYHDPSPAQQTGLAIHWDGTSWTQVPVPTGGTGDSLSGISMQSSASGWAIGSSGPNFTALYWDGSTWTSVPVPTIPTSYLSNIYALPGGEAWAVGARLVGPPTHYENISLHCTPSACTQVSVPNPGVYDNELLSITALSPTEVYAAGYTTVMTNPTLIRAPTLMRWDGIGWAAFPRPAQPGGESWGFRSVITFSPTDIVGLGFVVHHDTGDEENLALHWDGSTWTRITTPNPTTSNYFVAADALSPTDIWAVGYQHNPSAYTQTMAEHYSDPCPPIPTETPTTEPLPTTTPGTCAITFTDVLPGSPFYPYVLCLYCRNIIGGYSDNTFRPGNPVTRGQLSKIVSEAAAFSDDPGPQLFEDIPVGSTFYTWVNRLSLGGIISGYPCGGPGEPCGGGNLPYFRPNATGTRGQIAKIVSIARGFTDPPGSPLFEDVPEGSTFYDYVQRLANSSVMSGYPCNSIPTEPCGPTNLPYFRPSNQATRGQTSKIISNTFFPNCTP